MDIKVSDFLKVLFTQQEKSFTGISSFDLICLKQDVERDAFMKEFYEPWQKRLIEKIDQELERRNRLPEPDYINNTIVSAIKERITGKDLENIIGTYTEVFVHQNTYTFRCSLHPDKHPSGHIYMDEAKWHCFQCGAHGDVFDAVMKFQRVSFLESLSIVGKLLGISVKKENPLKERKRIRSNTLEDVYKGIRSDNIIIREVT